MVAIHKFELFSAHDQASIGRALDALLRKMAGKPVAFCLLMVDQNKADIVQPDDMAEAVVISNLNEIGETALICDVAERIRMS